MATEKFQSTRPRGARPALPSNLDDKERISIHAPAWGATMSQESKRKYARISIHAPAWGATSPL